MGLGRTGLGRTGFGWEIVAAVAGMREPVAGMREPVAGMREPAAGMREPVAVRQTVVVTVQSCQSGTLNTQSRVGIVESCTQVVLQVQVHQNSMVLHSVVLHSWSLV